MPGALDLAIVRADTFSEVVTLTDNTGAAINLTGYTMTTAVGPNLSPNPLTATITNAAAGEVTLACATSAPAITTKWSLTGTSGGGTVREFLRGRLSILAKVSE